MTFILGQNRGHIGTAFNNLYCRAIDKTQETATFWAYIIIGFIFLQLIYRHAISHVGVFTEMQFSSPEAMERFKSIWQGNGIGWLTHSINDTTLHAYAGSSTYNSTEMHRLIEFLMDEAQALGIETKPQEEVDALLKSWGAEK